MMNHKKQLKQHLIDKYKLNQEIHTVVPQIYAAFGIVLCDRGWTTEKIAELFADTQELWLNCVNAGTNMCELCEDVTGIDVRGKG